MILSSIIRNVGRCGASSLLSQHVNRLNYLLPISCYHHHFHQKDETLKIRRTGFVNNYSDLHKAIHSQSALYLKHSNLLGQKATKDKTKDETQTGKDDKKTEDGSLDDPNLVAFEEGKKLGLFARFKKMAKDYWYVLFPVHIVTSGIWLGAFYYTSKR